MCCTVEGPINGSGGVDGAGWLCPRCPHPVRLRGLHGAPGCHPPCPRHRDGPHFCFGKHDQSGEGFFSIFHEFSVPFNQVSCIDHHLLPGLLRLLQPLLVVSRICCFQSYFKKHDQSGDDVFSIFHEFPSDVVYRPPPPTRPSSAPSATRSCLTYLLPPILRVAFIPGLRSGGLYAETSVYRYSWANFVQEET